MTIRATEFIEANIEDNADTIRWLLEEIKNHQEDDSAQTSDVQYLRDQIVQWTLVALAFMLTITTSITKAYPNGK